MNRFNFFDKLIFFEKLVRQGRTGTPQELARRLSLSRSALYRIIDEINSHGTTIGYCRTSRTFRYNCDKVFEINFGVKVMTDPEEMRDISGGWKLFLSVPFFETEKL